METFWLLGASHPEPQKTPPMYGEVQKTPPMYEDFKKRT